MHMAKDLQANAVHGPFAHPAENRIAQFAKENVGETRRAIGDHHPEQHSRCQVLDILGIQGIHQVLQ